MFLTRTRIHQNSCAPTPHRLEVLYLCATCENPVQTDSPGYRYELEVTHTHTHTHHAVNELHHDQFSARALDGSL